MKTIIIANGTAPSLALLNRELAAPDANNSGRKSTIICADGGANILFTNKITPHFIIGDLDSISQQALTYFQKQGVVIEKYSPEKDDTDLDLALDKSLALQSSEIVFLGATGKRADHLLGNIGILFKTTQHGCTAIIKDDEQTIEFISSPTEMIGYKNQIFSLHAYSETVCSLNVEGSKYELADYDLKIGDGRTISNQFIDNPVKISFENGHLLLIKSS